MEDWQRLCDNLSKMFEQNKEMNFGITLTPEEVALYLAYKVLFVRINQTEQHEAALFVTNDGECGFACFQVSPSTYKYLVKEFNSFVIQLPEELVSHLWCRVQTNNDVINKLAIRLGFKLHQTVDAVNYYKYGG